MHIQQRFINKDTPSNKGTHELGKHIHTLDGRMHGSTDQVQKYKGCLTKIGAVDNIEKKGKTMWFYCCLTSDLGCFTLEPLSFAI